MHALNEIEIGPVLFLPVTYYYYYYSRVGSNDPLSSTPPSNHITRRKKTPNHDAITVWLNLSIGSHISGPSTGTTNKTDWQPTNNPPSPPPPSPLIA